MNLPTVLLWLSSISLDTCSQLAFKLATQHADKAERRPYWQQLGHSPWMWLGMGCYALELPVWIALLSLLPLSQAVLLSAINIVTVMLAGRLLFQEVLSPARLAGMLLIATGVVMVGTI